MCLLACRGSRSNFDDEKRDEEPSVSDLKSALGISREDETLRYFPLLSSSSSPFFLDGRATSLWFLQV